MACQIQCYKTKSILFDYYNGLNRIDYKVISLKLTGKWEDLILKRFGLTLY